MKLNFVTSNYGKFKELKELAKKFEITLSQLELDIPEIRGSLEKIAIDKAKQAYAVTKKPVVVDDSGFFIDAFSGFPGQFSAFVFKTLGNQGILKLMVGEKNRVAEFKTCAVFYDGAVLTTFTEKCVGTIIEGFVGRGSSGMGYDPIFIPENHNLTFAEDFEYKLKISHRTRAYEKLFNRLINRNCE